VSVDGAEPVDVAVDVGELVADLETIGKSDNPSYRALAAMTKSGLALQGGEADKAIADLKRVVDDAQAPQPLRDVAEIKLLRLQFDTIAERDTLRLPKPALLLLDTACAIKKF
jgi:hypothetical protein